MVIIEEPSPRIAVIRTSDRGQFKRCRRLWNFTSHLRQNRTFTESAEYLWLGTGCHYACEDFHGYNYYKHPVEAFRAYAHATRRLSKQSSYQLPLSVEGQITLGEQLLDYYMHWLESRPLMETLWIGDIPQVEVEASVKLPFSNEHYDEVYYQATFDRVVVIDNQIWVMDYKFYNRDWTPELVYDQQMSAYVWLASIMYQEYDMYPATGAIVQKHFKKVPDLPKILSTGKLSSDKSQNTTYEMYRQALIDMYGTWEKAPMMNRKCLDHLMTDSTEDGDKYIVRHYTTRNEEHIAATGASIMMELEDMLNLNLPLYKNETKDCSWGCSFRDICLAIDEGRDWEQELQADTVDRGEGDMSWRKLLPHLEK